jgi:hypothetical protein
VTRARSRGGGRRTAALAALALSACYSNPPTPLSDVIVYWEFRRSTFVDGVAGSVTYDADVSHPGIAAGSCPQSGVERVEVSDGEGTRLTSPDVPCIWAGVQGLTLLGFPGGLRKVVVRGFRAGAPDVLFEGEAAVAVVPGPAIPVTVSAPGVADALSVSAVLGGGPAQTCGAADVQRLEARLQESSGTVVWRGAAPCAPGDAAVVSLGPVDRGDYRLWLEAVRTTAVPAGEVVYSACGEPIAHLAPQQVGVSLAPGACALRP